MPYYFPANIHKDSKIMMFIDGENLAIRYGNMLQAASPENHVKYMKDVFVWTNYANVGSHVCDVMRRYYYTSVVGDETLRIEVEDKLKEVGIEAPRVFKKIKGKRSKRVDITLATDMLSHVHRKNYDLLC